MATDLTALDSELTIDPVGLGYAPLTAERDPIIADLINAETTGRTAVDHTEYSTAEIFYLMDKDEYMTAIGPAANQTILNHLFSLGPVDLSNDNIQGALTDVFGAGSVTVTNLTPFRTKTASRAEELGLGRVTASDVANTRRL